MTRKIAATLALLGFASVAAVEALRGGDLARAVPRMIFAAIVMGVVGAVTAFIAQKAVSEAVDAKMPLINREDLSREKEDDAAKAEDE